MDDLVRWLGEQLAEDERIARAARGHGEGRWRHDSSYPNGYVYDEGVQPVVHDESAPSPEEAEHIAEHDPARVLREIDAKRRILAEHDVYGRKLGERMDCQSLDFPCLTLRLLASVYSDRPGYRQEWTP